MVRQSHPPEIELATGSRSERRTRDLLHSLFDDYPLNRWRYAERVRIEDNVISHSHPVLTLNGRHDPRNPLRLLSSYIHEQLHWFWLLEEHEGRTWSAWRDLRDAFPQLPLAPPAGCGSERSTYLHVAINYWEYRALCELIGTDDARAFLKRKPYYTAVYGLVLSDGRRIQTILERHALLPPSQPPADKRFIVPVSGPMG